MSVHQRLGSFTVQQPDASTRQSEFDSPQGLPSDPEPGLSGQVVSADGRETEAGDAAVAGGSGSSCQSGQPELVEMDDESDVEHDNTVLEIGSVAPAPICAHYQPGLFSDRDTISARPSGSRLRTALGLDRPSRPAWEDIRPDGFVESDEVDRYERDYASDDDFLLV